MTLTIHSACVYGFEGPEKKLEILFKPMQSSSLGLRCVTVERWQEMLDHAKCTIISTTKNDHFDAFVLSESSLFVYPSKILIKTCGTTTLLRCIANIQELATEQGTDMELILYSRKNYNFPTKQLFPHADFDEEAHFLNKLFKGECYVLGPANQDHWSIFVADFRSAASIESASSQVFEVMMHDLDIEKMSQFYRREGVSTRDTTVSSGIASLLPGSIIDDFQFEPCGYSMNGLLRDWYWTIHITPEVHCSYMSFETNAPLESYTRLLRRIIKKFRPGRATITVRSDESTQFDPVQSFDPAVSGYSIQSLITQSLPGAMSVVACNLEACHK